MKFAFCEPVDRHGLSALAMTRSGEDAVCGEECSVRADDHTHSLSLRGGSGSGRRGNPSCLDRRVRLVSSVTGSQWIATGFQPSR
jgi:hypothetical protein